MFEWFTSPRPITVDTFTEVPAAGLVPILRFTNEQGSSINLLAFLGSLSERYKQRDPRCITLVQIGDHGCVNEAQYTAAGAVIPVEELLRFTNPTWVGTCNLNGGGIDQPGT